MTALLALIPTKDKLYLAGIILLIFLGIHIHNKLLAEGVTKQQAADAKATAALIQQTAVKTAELQAKATMAEQAYDKEHQVILDQPPLPAVRLCSNAHSGSPVVSRAGAVVSGDATPSAASGYVQPVPSGGDSVGTEQNPDISDLLSLLAQRADDYSAELREYQARE